MSRRPLSYEEEGGGAPLPLEGYRSSLTIWANGVRHDLSSALPTMSLLEWLRSIGLTGTKLGCGEGGCGACTVMVSSYDIPTRRVRHRAVNACLFPLCAADWCAVTTVEGIGSTREGEGLHPVQERMTQMHGSQCGFCTPGIVMAMYTLCRNGGEGGGEGGGGLCVADIEEHMDGNLCRCTGYRPILDAAKSLCSDAPRGETNGAAVDVNDPAPAGGACAKAGGGCAGDRGCSGGGGRCADPSGVLEGGEVVTTTATKLGHFQTPYAETAAAASEPPMPSELLEPPAPLRLASADGAGWWWRPRSLDDLLVLKRAYPDARLVVGNTEVGVETRFKNRRCSAFLAPCAASMPSLYQLEDSEECMRIGACASLSDVQAFAARCAASRPGRTGETARAVHDMLRWFASTQIRNACCLGGNLATASPISDMNPLLVACGASATLASAARGTRTVPLHAFFKSYRVTELEADELVVSITLPHSKEDEFVRPFKQARRREDDISIVTGTIRVSLAPSAGCHTVTAANLAFGGMAPTVVTAPAACAALVGQPWDEASVDSACAALQRELRLSENAPGGQSEYRGALASSFLFKFFVATAIDLTPATDADASPPPPLLAAASRSAATSWVREPKPSSFGTQRYPHASYPGLEASAASGISPPPKSAEQPEGAEAAKAAETELRVVGESMPHAAGAMHTTGEATYTDDATAPPSTLHAWLVRAEKAPATIEGIDASAARASPGVRAAFFADDLPPGGFNTIGPIKKDEFCFAETHVEHVGQVIGIVVAASAEEARIGSTLVSVRYGPPTHPPVYTISDAISASSFFDEPPFSTDHSLESGPPVDAALATAGAVVVSGTFSMGGQEHFYLEPNTTLAVPTDDGGLDVTASTQATDKTQKLVSRVTGIPANRVVARVRRMGGGFGGKETRSVWASCAVAVAAHKLRTAVRLTLRRDVDMGTSGGRHPFVAKYTAAALPSGEGPPKLVALDVKLYSNGGATLDLSGPVMDRALLHVDNVYKWPSFRARGVVCKTHTPPNTAFRGFGGPQGMLVTEAVMEHLASEMRISADELRSANMYEDDALTPFGQALRRGEWRVPRAWGELRRDCGYAERALAVEAFNREHSWRKRGICMLPTKYGINFTAKFMNQGGALVHLYTDGTVLISHGGTEMGQGLHTKVCQVAARAFGVPLSACHVAESASDKVANAIPTAASASTDLYCMATLDACRQILARLEPTRSRLRAAAGAEPSLAEIALAAFFDRVDLSAHGFFAIDTKRCGFDWDVPPVVLPDGTHDNSSRGHPFNYFTQGVGCVEVEVDVLTGDHSVLRADLLVDLGSSINPALDIGQIEGAFTQGMGWTTVEELVWGDPQHPWVPPGRLFTAGPGAYKLPAFNDTPREMNVKLMTGCDNKVAVHSSKAVGEPPFFLGAATFFAIRDAVAAARAEHADGGGGDHFFTFNSPATSERIRMACADRFARRAVGGEAETLAFQPKNSV